MSFIPVWLATVGLPGLWVLLSIFVFGDLWGVFGMIMAVPTTACLYVFFTEYVNHRLQEAEADCNRGNRVS